MVSTNKSHTIQNQVFFTHLAPNEARRLLPCIDRPDAKAYFNLSVVVSEPSHKVISNTSVVLTKGPIHVFERTPLMSSYLLVCVVG
jgi:aminopeptidase N